MVDCLSTTARACGVEAQPRLLDPVGGGPWRQPATAIAARHTVPRFLVPPQNNINEYSHLFYFGWL